MTNITGVSDIGEGGIGIVDNEGVRVSTQSASQSGMSDNVVVEEAQALSGGDEKIDTGDSKNDSGGKEQVNKWSALRTLTRVPEIYDTKEMVFPESTHTLLFSENICSIPFVFASAVAGLSVACLALALMNNPAVTEDSSDNKLQVPVNVTNEVRGAQYISIFVAFLMEEEIPQALLLLKAVSKGSFRRTFPELSFWRYLFSVLFRVFVGYLFLINVFLVIVQADNVLDIFYDMLALQFVQQLDDVAFSLAMRDMLGRRLYEATNKEYSIKPVQDARLKRRLKIFAFRMLFFANAIVLFLGVVAISIRQERGEYICDEIYVNFGDQVWQNDAKVRNADGVIESRTLVYSYFNGVYKLDEKSVNGYPRYVEQNKVDNSKYQSTVPAEFRYCKEEESWIFMHPDITKDSFDTDCPWLLKSEKTSEFDLLEVSRDWSIWVGVVSEGNEISYTCGDCEEDSDCNYHGTCSKQSCACDSDFFGSHCEHAIPCTDLYAPYPNGTLTYQLSSSPSGPNGWTVSYERPVYFDTELLSYDALLAYSFDDDTASDIDFSYFDDDTVSFYFGDEEVSFTQALIYSGSRWFGSIVRVKDGALIDFDSEYHAFWQKLYESKTDYLSDPTDSATPVAVDVYEIASKVGDWGPFGLLLPVNETKGAGFFHCVEN